MLRSGIVRVAFATLVIGLLATACIESRDGGLAGLLHEGPGGAAATAAGAPGPVRIMEIPAATGRSVPISLDLDMMRKARRRGALGIQLADGTQYPVLVESERSDFGGRSTFIGKVKTRTGMQSAVLTFGKDAVFGVLPMPDGRKLSVSTTNGVVGIALAGGIIPPGMEDHAGSDVIVPGRDGKPTRPDTPEPPPAAAPAPQYAPSPRTSSARAAAQAAPETMSLVRIDLLGLYGDDLVAFRGSASLAETEVVSMVAIANQAHVDSGSRVRLQLAATRLIPVPAGRYNGDLLNDVYMNHVAGLDIPSARDAAGADLVFVLRNYAEGDSTCGVGFLGSDTQNRSNVSDEFAYSVSATGACGPYTLAHELGHNLGAMHDRASSTSAGKISYGAYPYSFGYRACIPGSDNGFATVMAYQDSGDCSKDWLGYFSSPALEACYGMACGQEDRADNVRGFNRIATAIAAYRDRPGSLSIADIEGVEPGSGETRWISVPVRLTGVAPAGGVTINGRIVGGTATPGIDYEAQPETTLTIPAGERSASLMIAVLPDDAVEGDETILVHMEANADVACADATVTIVDDDPRWIIRGAMRFSPGSTPDVAIPLVVFGADGIYGYYSIQVSPPDFQYAIPVVAGSGVTLTAQPSAPYASLPLQVGQVDTDIQRDYDIPLGARVSGQLRVPPGGALPAQPVEMQVTTEHEGRQVFGSSSALMPGETFSYLAPPGTRVTVTASPLPPYVPYRKVFDRIDADHVSDIMLSTLPSMVVTSRDDMFDEENPGEDGGHAVVMIELSAPAPKEGVAFHYSTVPGSAKPGEDYVATSGTLRIEEGATMESVLVHLVADTRVEDDEDFYVDVDDVAGAVAEIPRARVIVRDNDRPSSLPSITLSGTSQQSEGDAGSRNVLHAVLRLSAPAPDTSILVSYYTVSRTAIAGEDFIPVNGTLTFAPGETEATIDIASLGDGVVEPDEYFDFVVEPIQGAVLASSSPLRFVLLNDDEPPPPEQPGGGTSPGDPPNDGGQPPSDDPPPATPPGDDPPRCVGARRGPVRIGTQTARSCH